MASSRHTLAVRPRRDRATIGRFWELLTRTILRASRTVVSSGSVTRRRTVRCSRTTMRGLGIVVLDRLIRHDSCPQAQLCQRIMCFVIRAQDYIMLANCVAEFAFVAGCWRGIVIRVKVSRTLLNVVAYNKGQWMIRSFFRGLTCLQYGNESRYTWPRGHFRPWNVHSSSMARPMPNFL